MRIEYPYTSIISFVLFLGKQATANSLKLIANGLQRPATGEFAHHGLTMRN